MAWHGDAARAHAALMQRYVARQLFDVKTIHGENQDYLGVSLRARGTARRMRTHPHLRKHKRDITQS